MMVAKGDDRSTFAYRDKCMREANANVNSSVGIFWSWTSGLCRAIDNHEVLLPWPNWSNDSSDFPDSQDKFRLCILNQVLGNNYNSFFIRIIYNLKKTTEKIENFWN